MRPPGAIGGAFTDLCTTCGDCIAACADAVLVRDPDGRPIVRFDAGACTFCTACAAACTTGALDAERVAAWPWRAIVSAACLSRNGINCRSCQDGCDEGAIRFTLQRGGRAEPALDTGACTGCGACAGACPVGAIGFERHDPAMLETVE